MHAPVQVAPAEGKVCVLMPGLGAVATTFMAGVEAVKRGLSEPVGSLTQMARIRLGRRTEGRNPKINEFVPLARLEDLVFAGWDIFEANAFESARNAAVLDDSLLSQLKIRSRPSSRCRPSSIPATCAPFADLT